MKEVEETIGSTGFAACVQRVPPDRL